MEKKYLIVNVCGPEQKKRLEDYLLIVLNKEMHFKFTYDNYYEILYISEDLNSISSINATSAALAPRIHKFTADEFMEWDANRRGLDCLADYKAKVWQLLKNNPNNTDNWIRDVFEIYEPVFEDNFKRGISVTSMATLMNNEF